MVRRDLPPLSPEVKLSEVVRAHQPDEARSWINAAKRGECFRCAGGAEPGLDVADLDAGVDHQRPRLPHPICQRRGGIGLQRVPRTDEPPHAGQPEPSHRLERGADMALVRRIERSAQKSDDGTPCAPWVMRSCDLRLYRQGHRRPTLPRRRDRCKARLRDFIAERTDPFRVRATMTALSGVVPLAASKSKGTSCARAS